MREGRIDSYVKSSRPNSQSKSRLKQSNAMAEENGWYTRKRKAPQQEGGATDSTVGGEKVGAPLNAVPSSTSSAGDHSSSASGIPESLLPFLGWTKLSACHRPRSKKRRNSNWNRDEALQKVTGRAIVSLSLFVAYVLI